MAQNTRTVLIWYSNGQERLTFAVNPRHMTFGRPQQTRELMTLGGEAVHVAEGQGLMSVTLNTFLPGESSRFYRGVPPLTALGMLRRWQASRRPVRLMISGTDINDAFLITRLEAGVREGDADLELGLALKEYRFITLEGAAVPDISAGGGLAPRASEAQMPQTHTVIRGDTLWALAVRYYGDGTRWRGLAEKNGVGDPLQLPVGKVLRL